MLKNVKFKFINGLEKENINKGDNILIKTFNQTKKKIFFVEDTYSNGEYLGMGIKKDGDFYEAVPIWIIADENSIVKEIKALDEVCADLDKGAYFAYWKDLFKTFSSEISGKVEYDKETLLEVFVEIMKEHEGHTYLYTDIKSSKFSLQILDQFEFIGQIKSGNNNEIIISNIVLRDRYNQNIVMKLPNIKTNIILEVNEEDMDSTEDVLFKFIGKLSKYEMIEYILSSIKSL